MNHSFVLKGDICYSTDSQHISTIKNGFVVNEKGISAGVYRTLPEKYNNLPLIDHTDRLILPGLCDLHMHAPQFAFRALGMDLELLKWLETRTFVEESKYINQEYYEKAYSILVDHLAKGPNTRICLFATIHLPATIRLMELLEQSGLVSMVGKVNMDRNSPDNLREESAAQSLADTRRWLDNCLGRFKNTYPILTPRFIPSCTDELMKALAKMQSEYRLPVQSHLSENRAEVEWVQSLCPDSRFYGDAYARRGLFGGAVPTLMAHCVWCSEEEIQLMAENGVYVAHCPQSNINLSSGIAPVRRFLDKGIHVGLGSDMAGGCHCSIFRAMADAIQVSKLHWCLADNQQKALSLEEAFYLGTIGGGEFFGKVGSFESGYEFDAIIMNDDDLSGAYELDIAERLARVIYLSDDRHIIEKYVRGCVIN